MRTSQVDNRLEQADDAGRAEIREAVAMAKYLFKISYTASGLQGVLKEGGSARQSMAEKTVQSAGGALESMYFAFGDTDAYIVADMPDAGAAASVALTVSAAGGATAETVVLLEADEIDAAVGAQIEYRPPGG
jgi:uncharacterized protein with GYD domain